MSDNEYSCSECTNSGTPICKDCRYIAYAGGTQSRPTRFCGSTSKERLPDRTSAFASQIAWRVAGGVPIPISLVMKYNELVSKK